MEIIFWLICENCDWQGEADELVSKTDDIMDFSYCPKCGGSDFDEEEEEIEEE